MQQLWPHDKPRMRAPSRPPWKWASCLQQLFSQNSTGRSLTCASNISDFVNIARIIKHVNINIIINSNISLNNSETKQV
jgi:hypothetical protein